jgi:NAD(P)H-dependent flavin oxidoreductase YrpB (nitropropane dioxygenase family)
MGVGVSSWELAGAVSSAGQLGVVSGTALEVVYARRLEMGDPDGSIRRAFDQFPLRAMADRVFARYYVAGGKPRDSAFRPVPMYTVKPAVALQELSVLATFAEIWLAKEGHNGPVGINYLYKIQLPLLASMYGAILAGVDYVIVGAGNPAQIPNVLTKLARNEEATLDLSVQYAGAEDRFSARFDPRALMGDAAPSLRRPAMLAIVASVDLAKGLTQGGGEAPDGFIIEGATAGGHNAPPRGPLQLDSAGQPIYGVRDEVDLSEFRKMGLPFWLAGSYGGPEQLRRALRAGAAGVQVGTAFAFCRESGLAADLKATVLRQVLAHRARVRTDPRASPSGFPFKVMDIPGTLSDESIYQSRPRVCDLGYLRAPYKTSQGALGYRCPAEPDGVYARKDGRPQNACGRKCLCNALLSNIGLGQRRGNGYDEPPLVTAGDDVVNLAAFLPIHDLSYSAVDVLETLLGERAQALVA